MNKDEKTLEKDWKFVLIVVDSNEKTKYFGPFDDGEEAIEWGEKHFNSIDYFLTSTTLYNPNI